MKKEWIRKPLCLDQKVAGRRIESLTVLPPGHVVIVIGEAEADGCKRGKNGKVISRPPYTEKRKGKGKEMGFG